MNNFYKFISNENQKERYSINNLLDQKWYNMNKILYTLSIMIKF